MGEREQRLDAHLNSEGLVPDQVSTRTDREHGQGGEGQPVPGRESLSPWPIGRSRTGGDEHCRQRCSGESRVEHAVPWREERIGLVVVVRPAVKEKTINQHATKSKIGR